MPDDPFANLSLAEIEQRARTLYPVLWWVAEFVVFVHGPWRYMRGWRRRKKIGYGSGRDDLT
jgi:hypothetical protein